MVCKLDRPEPQELFDRIKNNFSANVLGGYDVIPESNEWYLVSNDYMAHEAFYSMAEAQWKAQDPRFMCCDDLYDYAAVRGFTPYAASSAQGYVQVSGTPGAVIPSPLEMVIEGQNFRTTGTMPAAMPGSGFFEVRVRSVVPGAESNIAVIAGTGNLASAVAGIANTVIVRGSTFCGGADAEDCETFRARFLLAHGYHPRSNVDWIINKLKEWPCVTRVCERGGSCCETPDAEGDCGCNRCSQSLGFYVLMDDTYDCGIPPSCVITDINTWMWGDPPGKGKGQADFGMCGEIKAPVASVIDVVVTGMACATNAEMQIVRERITDMFRTACPSEAFIIKQVELAIAQVVGFSDAFEVIFIDRTGNMTFTQCGDLDPNCDILPCLGQIDFVGLPQGGGC